MAPWNGPIVVLWMTLCFDIMAPQCVLSDSRDSNQILLNDKARKYLGYFELHTMLCYLRLHRFGLLQEFAEYGCHREIGRK